MRPDSYETIRDAARFAEVHEMPLAVLGKGTNVLASDRGFDGLVIRFDTPLHEPVYDGTRVVACCGMSLTLLARETVKRGLMGVECLCGIPGTLGGACAMNAASIRSTC